MKDASPITVVIPVFNRASTLQRTLQSIDSQTLRPAAVIIVDNGSTDDSLAIANRWAEGRDNTIVLSEPRPGACAARNRGLDAVETEWTMFFDSDDVMLPNHIADFTRAIHTNPEASIIGRDIFTIHLDGRKKRNYFKAGNNAMFHHLFRGSLGTLRHMAKTDLYLKAGKWNEKISGWDDFELGVRMLLMSPIVASIPGIPSAHAYQQSESITGTSFSANPDRWEKSLDEIRNHFSSLPSSNPQRGKYLAWLDARSMILAAQYEREALAQPSTPLAEKSHALSRRLYEQVMSRTSHPHIMRLTFAHNRCFNRLTWVLVKLFSGVF